MIYLLLSIFSSTAIILLFKLFERKKIHTFQAIIINYFICVITGLITLPAPDIFHQFWLQPWFPLAIVLGFLFISGFYMLSLTVKKNGVTVASVASKNAMVMSVTAAFFLYDDVINIWKITGIIVAVIAIYLTTKRSADTLLPSSWHYFIYPLSVFIISGFIEVFLNFAQVHYLEVAQYNAFLIFLFGTAGTLGFIILMANMLFLAINSRKKQKIEIPQDLIISEKSNFHVKNLLAGIILGIPNYGSIYFLISALNLEGWEPSIIFPINNIGIVLLSALLAFFIFKERLNKVNLLGILFAVIAIVLISVGRERTMKATEDDIYQTLESPSTGLYREKGSRFIAYASPVFTEEEARQLIEQKRDDHPKSRHVCYAYRIGKSNILFRANDDGEPSGTAGKPILGQIDSFGLSNVVVAVVRYFGGTLLGVSGLINAYRSAAADALTNAVVVEKYYADFYKITFNYEAMNLVMSNIKKENLNVINHSFSETCTITISIRQSLKDKFLNEFGSLDGISEISYLYSS